MKRKKPKRQSTDRNVKSGKNRSASAAIQAADDPAYGSEFALPGRPSPAVRTWISLWLPLHLLAIWISFTSVVEPSSIHARFASLVHPYVRPTHFAADDRPVYLTHGNPSEQPHRLQVTTDPLNDMASVDTRSWQTVGPSGYAGLAVSDRTARWLSTAAMLAENDQPGLVAELLLPIAQSDPSVNAIRIVRLPTDLNDINTETESPYVARVVRGDGFVSLLELKSSRLSSQAIGSPEMEPTNLDQADEGASQ